MILPKEVPFKGKTEIYYHIIDNIGDVEDLSGSDTQDDRN